MSNALRTNFRSSDFLRLFAVHFHRFTCCIRARKRVTANFESNYVIYSNVGAREDGIRLFQLSTNFVITWQIAGLRYAPFVCFSFAIEWKCHRGYFHNSRNGVKKSQRKKWMTFALKFSEYSTTERLFRCNQSDAQTTQTTLMLVDDCQNLGVAYAGIHPVWCPFIYAFLW